MKATILILVFLGSGVAWAAETDLVEVLRQSIRDLDAREARPAAAVLPTSPMTPTNPLPAAAQILVAGDVVTLTVQDEPELGLDRATIDPEGRLTHKLLGAVPVAGKTAEQAGAEIRDLLAKDYLVDPKVRLVVVESALCSFAVGGAVAKPGVYFWPGREAMPIWKAIGLAGGPLRGADLTRVSVERRSADGVQTQVLNLEQLKKEPNARPFLLRGGDVLGLPRR